MPTGYDGYVVPEIRGRDPELDTITTGLAVRPGRLNPVILEGPPGIGKTSLVRTAVARWQTDHPGRVVLSAQPLESERDLVFSTLGDLFARLNPKKLTGLPEPQQAALDAALLRSDPVDAPARYAGNIRVVGTAIQSVLARLAATGTVLIVIDDLQWADPASVAALRFALHRLGDADLAVLLSQRVQADPFELDRGLDSPPVWLRLAPLEPESVFAMVRDRLGVTLPVPSLNRVMERSQGNPMYALELVRAFGASPAPPTGDPLPASLDGLIDARLADIPPEWDDVLLALALSQHLSIDELDAVVPHAADVMAQAHRAGLVEWRDNQPEFAHPLLASAVVRRSSPPARRAAHQRLAGASSDPESRARHLALAATGPDEAIAEALAEAAEHAASRGAAAQAAELMELSRAATPDEFRDRADERGLRQTDFLDRAGDARASAALLAELKDTVRDDRLRAKVILLYASIAVGGTGTLSAADAIPLLDETLELTDDPNVRAQAHLMRGVFFKPVNLDQALTDLKTALALLESTDNPDPYVYVPLVTMITVISFQRDGRYDEALVKRATAVDREHPNPNVGDRFGMTLGKILKDRGKFAEAREFFLEMYQAAVNEGAFDAMPFAVSGLPQVELWSGHPDAAERWAREHLALAEQTGRTMQTLQGLANLAEVLTWADRLDEAAAALEKADSLSLDCDQEWADQLLAGRRGLLALARGDTALAAESFRRAAAVVASAGSRAPVRTDAELAEILILSGALSEAREVIDRLEAAARRIGHHGLTGAALTARATLCGAEQRLDEAIGYIKQAYAELEQSEEPFLMARAKLAEGRLRRRLGERKAAVEAFSAAEALFAQTGAAGWVRAAAAERNQIPIKRGTGVGLTDTESRIADAIRRGLSNAQIAGEQFISVKTVEANLTRIYTKLGLRSRAQLVQHLSGGGRTPEPAAQ